MRRRLANQKWLFVLGEEEMSSRKNTGRHYGARVLSVADYSLTVISSLTEHV